MNTDQLLQEINSYKYTPTPRPLGLDIERIPFNDQKTWDLICSGNTKGIFQFESRLGQTWCKKCLPESIEDLAEITSALRPGTLQSKSNDGRSMTEVYASRKTGKEEGIGIHPSIDEVTQKTQHIILFQETILEVARVMAGFSAKDRMRLLKGVGKKKADLILSLQQQFIDGCVQNGHKEESAREVFEMVKAASRYAFNKCVSPYTTVQTDTGEILSLDEVCRGQKIKTPTGYATVVEKYDNGNKLLWGAVFSNGKTITCTVDHKFLCEDGSIIPLWQIMLTGKNVACDTDGGHSRLVKVIRNDISRSVDIEIDSEDHIFFGDGIATSNSHAAVYSLNSYRSAYLKAHYPVEFHLNWLRHAKSKPDTKLEMRELIMSARRMNIDVKTPKWGNMSADFSSHDRTIYFGVSNVKNCGKRDYDKLLELKDQLTSSNYVDILLKVMYRCNKRAIENLITVGFLDELGFPRTKILHDLSCVRELTAKEYEFACSLESPTLEELLLKCVPARANGGAAHTEARSEKLAEIIDGWKNPGKTLIDIPVVYTDKEEELLGVAISYSRIESTGDAGLANTTCLEFQKGSRRNKFIIACEILTVREHKCKNDSVMAFLTVEDETSELADILVFSDVYEAEKCKIYPGAIVLLFGERSNDALIVQKVETL